MPFKPLNPRKTDPCLPFVYPSDTDIYLIPSDIAINQFFDNEVKTMANNKQKSDAISQEMQNMKKTIDEQLATLQRKIKIKLQTNEEE